MALPDTSSGDIEGNLVPYQGLVAMIFATAKLILRQDAWLSPKIHYSLKIFLLKNGGIQSFLMTIKV